MKKNYALLFLIIGFSFTSIATNNVLKKTPPTFDSITVIISLNNNAQGKYAEVKNAIKSMPNISYVAYCGNHNIFMLYVNKQTYTDAEAFLKALLITNSQLKSFMYLKNGNIKEFLNFCSFSDPVDASNNKH